MRQGADDAGWVPFDAEQRRRFEEDGFLVVEDALTGDRLAALDALAAELEVEHYRGRNTRADGTVLGMRPVPLGPSVEFHDVLLNERILDLVDDRRLLPAVVGVLGWNIAVYLATIAVAPPRPADARSVAEHVRTGWHQDSSRVNDDLQMEILRPRLSVKVAWFLTDLTEGDGAAMWVVPGSHRCNELPQDAAQRGVPLRVPAGTAVVFDRRLWHSASPNRSDRTRRVVFVGYAFRWMREHDDLPVSRLWTTASPLRRQLLGWAPDATSRYAPEPKDVPLARLAGTRCAQGGPASTTSD